MKTPPNRTPLLSAGRLAALAVPVALLIAGLNFNLDWLGHREAVAQTEGDNGGRGNSDNEADETLKDSLVPLRSSQRHFEIIEGDDRGDVVVMRMQRSDAPQEWDKSEDASAQPQRWTLALDDYNTVYLQRSDAGAIDLTRLDIQSEADGLIYDQPLVLVPARVKSGRTIKETGRVALFDLRSGKIKSRGKVTHRIERISRSDFDTPGGMFNGYLLRISQEIDLPNATIEFDLWLGCSPGKGIVYRRTSTTIEKLGLFGSTTVRTAVLTNRESNADQDTQRDGTAQRSGQ